MFGKIRKFFEEARQEFMHVNWPSRAEAMRLTAVVIVLSIALALFLWLFDLLFSDLLRRFIV